MSTRATVHFYLEGEDTPESLVYRHGDGYPAGLGRDLVRFCDELEQNLDDTRFCDPGLLAARWVVFDAHNYQETINACVKPGEPAKLTHRCDFLSVRVLQADSGGIEYRYLILCRGRYGPGRRPRIICQKVSCSYPGNVWTVERKLEIPNKSKRGGKTRIAEAA